MISQSSVAAIEEAGEKRAASKFASSYLVEINSLMNIQILEIRIKYPPYSLRLV